jgi:hypothetical protein
MADSLAMEYVKYHRQKNNVFYENYFVNVSYIFFRDKGVYALTIYFSSRPMEGLNMPFHYKRISNFDFKGAIFHYDSALNIDKRQLIEELRKEKLLIEVEGGKVRDWDEGLSNDFESWHCLVCQNDFRKIKILISPSSLRESDVMEDVCI